MLPICGAFASPPTCVPSRLLCSSSQDDCKGYSTACLAGCQQHKQHILRDHLAGPVNKKSFMCSTISDVCNGTSCFFRLKSTRTYRTPSPPGGLKCCPEGDVDIGAGDALALNTTQIEQSSHALRSPWHAGPTRRVCARMLWACATLSSTQQQCLLNPCPRSDPMPIRRPRGQWRRRLLNVPSRHVWVQPECGPALPALQRHSPVLQRPRCRRLQHVRRKLNGQRKPHGLR